ARIFVTGKIEVREDDVKLIADHIEEIVLGEEDLTPKRRHHLRVRLLRTGNETHDVIQAQDVMRTIQRFSGADTFELHVPLLNGDGRIAVVTPQDNRVNFCPELQSALEQILGSGAVTIGPPTEQTASTRELATA
ncbi:MAG TPA: hypothetical protein VKB76_02450, partial [Ktedonobacterales bacterium]|nr:hypothetical protein [Ktedonobacterales bacterium]